MRLAAYIAQLEVILLVDTGSTHNFIDARLAKKLKLPIVAADRLQVLTASGDKLFTQGLCHSVNWTIQDFQFSTNFLLLPIKGCDLVLGTQWLLSLGPVVWDFSHLTMQFNYQNQ